MKSILKKIVKRLWWLTNPIRQPIADRFGSYLRRRLLASEQVLSDELNILLNHVVRELHRTRRHVEELQELVDGLTAERHGQLIAIKSEERR